MCKDKRNEMSSRLDGLTVGESACVIGNQIKQDVLSVSDPQAINWDNLRLLFAAFLEKFGPLVMPLIISWLTPKSTAKS